MSFPVDQSVKCYICRKISTQSVLLSTSRFGYADLDLRPPEMERSSMDYWIQECPHCGYTASDISRPTTVTQGWLERGEYLSCDNRTFRAGLAEKFYRQYLINVQDGHNKEAFYAALHAAWACDDVGDNENAIYCRTKALEELDKFVADQREEETFLVMRSDLLRRAEQFDLLIAEYEGKTFSEEFLSKIVAFEVEKAKQKDATCYTVAFVARQKAFRR